MEGRWRLAPRLEVLEPRVALSALGHHLPGVTSSAHVRHASHTHTVPLAGTLETQFSTDPSSLNGTITGSGSVNPLGSVTISGTVFGTARNGGGTMVLAQDTDRLTLRLDVHPAVGPHGPRIHFTVIGGSGAYAGATGGGRIAWGRVSADAATTANPMIPLDVSGTVRIR